MPFPCNKCKKINKDLARFCYSCGSKLLFSKGDILKERYEIIDAIKISPIMAIYKAKDKKLDIFCVVKELFYTGKKKSVIDRFEREAKVLANLKHKKLPAVIDYFLFQERYYLIMDFVDGDNLLNILKKNGNPGLSERIVVNISLKILEVLDYLHSQTPPVVYRDLKPSNIMLDKKGEVKLIDFGIARHINPESKRKKTAIGTEGYAPGEQYFGGAEPRSDIYALGATMHHLITGKNPNRFKFKPIKEIIPTITPELDYIIMKALKYKPDDRFSSAAEMKYHLTQLPLKREEIKSKEKKKEKKNKISPQKNKNLIYILTLSVIIILFIFFLSFTGNIPDINSGEKEFKKGNYDSAKKYYEKVLTEDKNNIKALERLARIALIKDNSSSAIEYYLKIIALAPKEKESYGELINIYILEKDYLSAKKKLDNMPVSKEAKKDRYRELSSIFIEDKKYEEAIDCLGKILEIEPGNLFAIKASAECYSLKKDYGEACKFYKKILRLTGPDINSYMALGEIYFKMENYKEANYNFTEALKLREKEEKNLSIKFHLTEGINFFNKGDYEEAKNSFDKVMAMNPEKKIKKLIENYVRKFEDN